MSQPSARPSRGGLGGRRASRAILRAAAFLGLWLMLAGATPADLPAALVAVVAATWTSLRLLPAGAGQTRPAALVHLALRFLWQSVVAGADVAWRALDPRLPLRPGFVVYPVRLPPGPARNTFYALTSQVPGTVPAGPAESGGLLVHCLDVDRPVVTQLAAEEAMLLQALGREGAMDEFLLGAAGLVLAMVALGLLRILRGPDDAERMMAAQLLGTGGIASLLLLGAAIAAPAAVDVALTLALLTTFAAIAFVKKGTPRSPDAPPEMPGGGGDGRCVARSTL